MQIIQPHIIHVSGRLEVRFPANNQYFTWEELSVIVGGFIEIVDLDEQHVMVLNDEGRLLGLPWNKVATDLFNIPGRAWYDPIVGDVLVCNSVYLEPPEDDDTDVEISPHSED